MLKYHSTPKPVRIRIESGGGEHFSLDSLLKCFNPIDLLGKKNELLRWLDFQGEEGKLISDELIKIDNLNQDKYRVYKVFFHKDMENYHINKIEELYALWAKTKGKNFDYLRVFLYDDGIRLQSGGEEHFSLDTLRKCFNPKELFEKKSELLRWLEFQGEEGKSISEKLIKIDKLNQDIYGVYKAFFHKDIEDNQIEKIEELYALWAKTKDKNFDYLKAYCYDDEFLIEKLYLDNKTRELENNWLGVIKGYIEKNYFEETDDNILEIDIALRRNIGNPNLLYYLGILFKEKDELHLAKIYLQAAKDKGTKKNAKDELEEIEFLLKRDRFYGVDKDRIGKLINGLINNWINNWDTPESVIRALEWHEDLPHLSEKERQIIELAFNYMKAINNTPDPKKNDFIRPSRRYQMIKRYMKPNSDDFLKKEKTFILSIYGCDEGDIDNSKVKMKNLAKSYIPAKYFTNDNFKNSILDKTNLRASPIFVKVQTVLRNIFSFENDANDDQ